MELLENLRGVVALGSLAFLESLRLLQVRFSLEWETKPAFGHNVIYHFRQDVPWLLASYHPSRQNTQTGRLTLAMFAGVWERVRVELGE